MYELPEIVEVGQANELTRGRPGLELPEACDCTRPVDSSDTLDVA